MFVILQAPSRSALVNQENQPEAGKTQTIALIFLPKHLNFTTLSMKYAAGQRELKLIFAGPL